MEQHRGVPRFLSPPSCTPPPHVPLPQHVVTLGAMQCAVDGCVLPPTVVRPSVYSPWSSPATWPSGVVPSVGDDVLIAGNMAVELDVSPPALGALRIDGALRFKDDADRQLHAGKPPPPLPCVTRPRPCMLPCV